MRTAWYDEVITPDSYDYEVNNGWEPPGIFFFKDITIEWDDDDNVDSNIIPFNTKGLMYIDYWVAPDDIVWYQVIWKDRTIWINKEWLVLIKAGSEDSDDL